MCVLEVLELEKNFHGETILKEINLRVNSAEIAGIVGENASGKSVLFKCISGLMVFRKGKIKILGEDITRSANYQKELGALIEYPAFIPSYSGFRNLSLLSKFNKKINNQEIKRCMHRLGLDPEDRKPVKKYSLGMRQKLGIIAAVMEKPKLILLDEPTNNLDEASVMLVHELIREMKEKYKSAILMTGHNHEEIQNLCDCIYELKNGVLTKQKG